MLIEFGGNPSNFKCSQFSDPGEKVERRERERREKVERGERGRKSTGKDGEEKGEFFVFTPPVMDGPLNTVTLN